MPKWQNFAKSGHTEEYLNWRGPSIGKCCVCCSLHRYKCVGIHSFISSSQCHNYFRVEVITLLLNKAYWLGVASHVTSFNQSEKNYFSTVTFAYSMQPKSQVSPMAIPSKMLCTESANTMTKLLMEDSSFFSRAFSVMWDFSAFDASVMAFGCSLWLWMWPWLWPCLRKNGLEQCNL